MGPAKGEKEELSLVKNGAIESPIRQMAGVTVVGIVDQDNVTRIQIPFELVQDVLHGEFSPEILYGQANRDGHGSPRAIPDAHGDVVELSDQIILGSSIDHVAHFPADTL
jgi:hypothetical protein